MSKPSPTDLYIEHHGVKGMKWGVTRDEAVLNRIGGRRVRAAGGTKEERKARNAQAKSDWKNYKSSTTRKERKADKRQAAEEKMRYLLEKAAKEPLTIFSTPSASGYNTLVTGREMIDHMSRGGALNPISTDVFATYS